MPLSSDIKFQKMLALAAKASNSFEAEAAELAARRMIKTYNIDPTDIPDISLYSHHNFRDNYLLKKLRQEWREAHPLPVKTYVLVKDQVSEDLNSPSISFNINGFRKVASKRRRSTGRTNGPRKEERIERLRQLFNSGKSRSDICKEHGYTQGEISGILRDCTGATGAPRRSQDNPRWVAVERDGRVVYNLKERGI